MEASSWSALPFHVVVKPIGPLCTLRCTYCFYHDTESLYPPSESWRMSDDTLETFIRQYVAAQVDVIPEIFFMFTGGEPTLMGLEFYRRVVELQQKHVPPGKRICNMLQTNGILLDDQWCQFFRAHQFLVGLSLDGPAEFHDGYRRDASNQGTFDRVMQALRCLQKHGVPFNVLACIHRQNAEHPLEVYRFLRASGVAAMQLDPVVCYVGDSAGREAASSRPPETLVTAESVLPEQFGRFLIAIFDEWLAHDVGRVQVSDFDQALAAWLGVGPSYCVYQPFCGRALALEHNGDVYSCDHFVDERHKLGNIHQTPLREMFGSVQQQQFGLAKAKALPASCRTCDVRFACQGACPKDRHLRDVTGEPGLNFLCAGYRQFFHHIAPVMNAMAAQIRAGCPARKPAPQG